jgi:hypothetical protein
MQSQFIEFCKSGNLDQAKKFLEENENPTIDISVEYDCAFRYACWSGHLEVAKWLLEIKPTIDISAFDEEAFRYACFNRHLDVAKWFQSLFPKKYHIEVVDGKIISYKVTQIIQNTIKMEKEQIVMCLICQENLSDVQTSCKHLYCENCIETWLDKKSSCPYCRENVKYDMLYKIQVV